MVFKPVAALGSGGWGPVGWPLSKYGGQVLLIFIGLTSFISEMLKIALNYTIYLHVQYTCPRICNEE